MREREGRRFRYSVLIDNLNCLRKNNTFNYISLRNFIVDCCSAEFSSHFVLERWGGREKGSRCIFPLWNCVIFLRMALCVLAHFCSQRKAAQKNSNKLRINETFFSKINCSRLMISLLLSARHHRPVEASAVSVNLAMPPPGATGQLDN